MSSGDTRGTVYLKSNPKENKQANQRLETLNQRLEIVRQSHIPETPYLLGVQSRRQFHLSEYQYREEFKESETGFKLEERNLQYQTFLSKGWEGTILSVITSEQQVNGAAKSKAMASTNGRPKSAAKKISIDDYKKRSSLPARSVNGSSVTDEVRNRAISNNLTSSSAGTKRSSDVLEKSKLRVADDVPPAKKLKPSPRLGPSGSRSPPTKIRLTLPPPLSPTLPAFVERLLSRTNDVIHKTQGSELPAINKKVKLSNIVNAQESQATKQHNIPSTSKPFSQPLQTSKTVPNGAFASPSISQHRSNHSSITETATSIAKERSLSKPSVIVRLKIPQDRRKDVSRLLKLPPKMVQTRKAVSQMSSNLQQDRKPSEKPSAAGKSAEKRPREDETVDIQHESKRSKSPAYQDQISSKKMRESTPISRDEATTPQGATTIGTPIPPTSTSKGPRDKQTPSETGSSNSNTSERLEGLQKLQTRYSELGLILKREGDKLKSPDMSPALKKKFIASRIESTLAFMLSYIVGDEVFRLKRRAPKPEITWDSLFIWFASVHQLVNDQPYVSGLLLQLEAISLMVVWRQRSEIAENSDFITIEKQRELRSQCEDAQRKFVRGSARLSVDDLQNEFPKTWKTKARLPLAHIGYKMTKDNLNGDFYLPLTSISLPIEGVRAGMTFLAEWCRREGVDWTAKLDF